MPLARFCGARLGRNTYHCPRWHPAKSLGLIGPDAAASLPDLKRAAESDVNSEVRKVAQEAIEKIVAQE